MSTKVVSLYTEATPNPQTMKFVFNRMLFSGNSIDFRSADEVGESSPLATEIFKTYDYISGIFIANNFITLSKQADAEWMEVLPELRQFVKDYISADKPVVNEDKLPEVETNEGEESDVVEKIKSMLQKYVQPAVEMDGGAIVFKSFDEGIVTLGMQGACSGCPSSTITLKAGIEGMMKRMVPEVKEVVAEAM